MRRGGMNVPDMSGEEAAAVRAELVALQAIVMSVFRRMVDDRPELVGSVCRAFDEAETILSGVAVKMGVEAPADCAIDALQVLEQIRAGVIRDDRRCGPAADEAPSRAGAGAK